MWCAPSLQRISWDLDPLGQVEAALPLHLPLAKLTVSSRARRNVLVISPLPPLSLPTQQAPPPGSREVLALQMKTVERDRCVEESRSTSALKAATTDSTRAVAAWCLENKVKWWPMSAPRRSSQWPPKSIWSCSLRARRCWDEGGASSGSWSSARSERGGAVRKNLPQRLMPAKWVRMNEDQLPQQGQHLHSQVLRVRQ